MPPLLRQILSAISESSPTTDKRELNLQLATAALLVEMMHADHEVSSEEDTALRSALQQEFGLDDAAVASLVVDAQREAREAPGYFAFTKEINHSLPLEDKLRIMEYLWRVALADGHLAAHENHLMRKLADLIHIGHGDYHAAKQRAIDALGQR